MTETEEWQGYIAELLELAKQTDDAARRRRLFALAERWRNFAEELGESEESGAGGPGFR